MSNLKQMKTSVKAPPRWRFALVFDPERKAVVICGGAKSDVSQKLFDKRLIAGWRRSTTISTS
jgi:hypothetical protein